METRVNPVGRLCWGLLTALCLASLAGHLALFSQLPDVVATHFGVSGEVNGWSSKWVALGLDVLPLALLALLHVVPRIDPRGRNYERFGGVYQAFVVLFTILMVLMTWSTEAVTLGWLEGRSVGLLVPIAVGVLFVAIGNYLPRVRDNYTFGFRTPWALNDSGNWRRTQRAGGVALVASGVAFILAGVLGGGVLWFSIALGVTLAGVLAVYLYSYRIWKRG